MAWIVAYPKKNPVSWYLYDRIKGKKTAVKIGTYDTRADAEKALAHRRAMADSGFVIDYVKGKKLFRDYFQDYIDEFGKYKKAYLAADRFVYAAMLSPDNPVNVLMDKPLAKITADDIKDWLKCRRQAGIKSGTLRRQLTYVKNVFKACREEWGIKLAYDPLQDVKTPDDSPARTRRISKTERKKLIEMAGKDGTKYLPLVIEFALETAMRQGEIGGALLDNFDNEHKTLYLPKTKNGSERTVPLSDRAIEIIKMAETKGLNKDGLIFGTSGNAIKKAWQAFMKKHPSFKDLHFHDTRHERTSQLFEQGRLDFTEVKLVTGHKSHASLLRYTHLEARHVGRVMRGESGARESE